MRRSWGICGIVGLGALGLLPATARAGDVVSETTTEPQPGIVLVERVEDNPRNRIYAAYISLCTDQVHMTATAPATGFRTPGGWGGDEGVQLAINGDFFTSGPQVYGDAVGGGVSWPVSQTGKSAAGEWYYERYGWIAFGDGWVEFNHTERTKLNDADRFGVDLGWAPTEVTTAVPSGTQSLVSGFPELVIEGQTYTCSSPTAGDCFPDRTDMRDRHPRSAMGLTADRQTLILVAVDGRDAPASVGMYGAELAELMADLGAWEAFNLDGGGSTGMWLAGSGYVNQPSDGSARAVANHWGVFAGDDGGQPSEPGSCFAPGGCFPTALAGAETEPFGDMPPAATGYAEAAALLEAGWVAGCRPEPEPLFCPRCNLKRGAAAKLAIAGAGLSPEGPAAATFDDVPTDHALFATIETAVAHGLMTGCSATSFCPGDDVPRGELAGVIRRAAGWDAGAPELPGFDDVSAGDASYDDVQALVEHCADDPCGDGLFCPDQPALRDTAAIMFARAFELVPAPACAPGGDDGGTATGDGGSATGGGDDTGAPDSGAADTSGGDTTEGLPDTFGSAGDEGGCGCRGGRPAAPTFAWALVILGAALRRRR
jgi:MYXO-CTERM domain-containing protein